jgi:citrate lyase beta subunit
MRSILMVPAHNDDFVSKARYRGADQICWDFEDGVPPILKGKELLDRAKGFIEPGDAVRVPPGDALIQAWLLELVNGIDVWIAKAGAVGDVMYYDMPLNHSYVMIETALGLFNLSKFVTDCPDIDGFVYGPSDMRVSMRSDWYNLDNYAEVSVIAAARACGIDVIAPPSLSLDYDDVCEDIALKMEAGYDGMMMLHPIHIDAMSNNPDWFGMGDSDIRWAQTVLDAKKRHPTEAVFTDNDNIIGPPMVNRAKQILGLW